MIYTCAEKKTDDGNKINWTFRGATRLHSRNLI